jgi:photosystem II stability/assembly factor-like uncharacterized protein
MGAPGSPCENPSMRSLCILLIFCTTLASAQSLTRLDSRTTADLRGVSAVSGSVWASGTHGTYLRSSDNGSTWTAAQVPGAEALDFRDVEAFSADEAYLLAAGPGDQSRIYKTTDAGRHWSQQFTNSDPKGFYDCFAFWDRDHGIVVGDPVDGRFELLTTEDGGTHWTQLPASSRPEALPREGAFAASGSCIAVEGADKVWFATGGPAARVFRSTDRGRSWKVTETPLAHGSDSSGIFSIAFRDAKHGLIAGGDYQHPDADGPNLASSDDGGATWQLLAVHPQFYFSAIGFFGTRGGDFLAVGSTHSILGFVGDPAQSYVFPTTLNALSASGPNRAFVVGPKGMVAPIELSNGRFKTVAGKNSGSLSSAPIAVASDR